MAGMSIFLIFRVDGDNHWRHSYEIYDGDGPSIPIDYT
jgi:hypothetical protein